MNIHKSCLLGLWLIFPGFIFAGDAAEPDQRSRLRLRLQSSERFLKAKPAADFAVARTEAFEDTDAFCYSVMRFKLPESPGEVFSHYTKANPLQVWKGSRSRIHSVYLPSSGRVLTPGMMSQNWNGFEEGMKLFIDMSALPIAVINKPAMMIGLEIVEIDPVKRVIVLAYLEGTPSYGFQRLHFTEAPAEQGGTVIVHEAWFQSYQKPVEKLYPYYHRKMLKSMHRRFRKSLAADRSSR